MQILLIPINLATVIAINTAGSYQTLTTKNQQNYLCVKAIVQLHFSSTHSIIDSFTRNALDDSENTRSVSPYWEHAVTTDALLDSIHSESRWSVHISRATSNLQTFRAQEHKWNCIIMIWETQGNRTANEIITSQLYALQDAVLLCNKFLLYSYLFQVISVTS
jgi:hypothetical protein